jgi:uncharacterized membrane protein
MENQDISDGKNIAVISYLTIFGTIIAFILNNDKKNKFASFHIRQSLGLWLTFFVLGYVITAFDSWLITFCFWMFFGVLFIYGFINALAGKPQAVPLIGDFFQKLFASIGN